MFEQRLMAAVARGDLQARESLVSAHYRAINRFLNRLTFGNEEAHDLTQQTFVQATSKAESFRGECSVRSWLRGIAYHEYTHWLRRKERDYAPLSETQDSTLVNSDAVVLHEAIAQLTPILRESFLLHEVVGLSVREMSDLLKCPSGTIKFRLSSAREALRKLLANPEDNYETNTDRRPDPSRCPSA